MYHLGDKQMILRLYCSLSSVSAAAAASPASCSVGVALTGNGGGTRKMANNKE